MIDIAENYDQFPDELKQQLIIGGRQKQPLKGRSVTVIKILQECNYSADLNQILTGIWEKEGEVVKRTTLYSHMNYMRSQGLLTDDTKAGTYQLNLRNADVQQVLQISANKAEQILEELANTVETSCANCSTELVITPGAKRIRAEEMDFCSNKCKNALLAELDDIEALA